ncbi:MAG: hypothetical protein AB7T22_14195 [Calditrichaceae bacterium]
MSNQTDYQAKIIEIEALPDEQTKSPNMPVDVFLQEAENLSVWCQQDKDLLIKAGLNWSLVDDLSVRAGVLREAESFWFNARFAREKSRKEWKEKSPLAFDLRNRLLHDFGFAFRNDEALAVKVSAIAKGSRNADMIQDLNDLAVFGKANPGPLSKTGFEFHLLDEAAAKADEMADLLSRAASEREKTVRKKIIRNKAYTLLKNNVDEIRACGQYVFWRNEERIRGYISHYHKKRRTKNDEAPRI